MNPSPQEICRGDVVNVVDTQRADLSECRDEHEGASPCP